jgi:BASS family bile acid:Na+ symporter
MSEVMQFIEDTFKPMVLIFTVANLGYLGLRVKMPELITAFKNIKSIALIVVWGWVLGPAVAYLLVKVFSLAEPFAIVLLIASVAPCAPFFPLVVAKARGDVAFAAAFYPLVVVGAVVLIPLMAPLMIEDLAVSMLDLAIPLMLNLLLPLIIGAAFRHYLETAALKILPAVNVIARLSTAVMLLQCIVLFTMPMLETAGSFGLLSGTIFNVAVGWITYRFGFGLKQNQRSVMSLGMLTRNMPALLIAAFAIPNVDPLVIPFTVMWGVFFFVYAFIAGRIFGKQAEKTVAGNTT